MMDKKMDKTEPDPNVQHFKIDDMNLDIDLEHEAINSTLSRDEEDIKEEEMMDNIDYDDNLDRDGKLWLSHFPDILV